MAGYNYTDTLYPFSLNTYTFTIGVGVNDGSAKDPSTYAGIVLLSFINIDAGSTGRNWFYDLSQLIKDAEIKTYFQAFIVAFRYVTTPTPGYANFVTGAVGTAITGGGAAESDFTGTPVVMDNTAGNPGLWSGNYLASIGGGLPSTRDFWCYLTGKDSKICDKWHTSWTAPISFNHLLTKGFNPTDYGSAGTGTARSYVKERIKNLNALLKIVDSDPINGTVIGTPSAIRRVFYSRPLAATGAAGDYGLTGGGVANPPPPPLYGTALGSSPGDAAENGVTLGLPVTGLTDTGADDDVTLTITEANVQDTDAATNTLQDPNTLSFRADLTLPVLQVEAILIDGTGADARATVLKSDGTKPLVLQANRTLKVRILCNNPGTALPSGRLVKMSDGTTTPLVFNGLIADEALASAAIDGASDYELHIDDYHNAVPALLPAAVFKFEVYPVGAYTSYADALEGWGYFPREEGLPTACPEAGVFGAPDDASMVPAWEDHGAAAATPGPGGGNPLVLKTNNSANGRWFRRHYGCGLKNTATGPGVAWDAAAYVEAVMSVSGTTGSIPAGFDGTASPTAPVSASLKTSGVGLRIRNGPAFCEMVLLEQTSGTRQVGLRIHYQDQDARAYVLANQDWTAPHSYRLARAIVGGDPGYSVFVDGSAAALVSVKEKYLPLVLADDGAVDAEVRFGVLDETVSKDITASFECVRYAFYDSKYDLSTGNILSVGFPDIYRDAADQAGSFFRSRDVTVNGLITTDPVYTTDTPALTIAAAVTKTAAGALAGKPVPAKVRFCLADWDDSSDQSLAGFTDPTTFPSYYPTTGPSLASLAGAGPSVGAISLGAGAAVTVPTPNIAWTVTVDRARLARRLFILAYADAPLLAAPKLIGQASAAAYFDRTMAGATRADPRGIVRGFLPDFFVRDYFGDDGSSVAGGWLSPDVAMTTYFGTTGITPDTAHALRTPYPPDPRAVDATNNSYPSGFALGEPYDAGSMPADFPYTPTGSIDMKATGAASTIKVSDSGYSDYTTQCYFNRMWVRVSNRGIVPGPARVQVFFLGAQMRAQFDPRNARAEQFQLICSNGGLTTFIQDLFQRYDNSGNIQSTLVGAVPPLSGAATPGVTGTAHQNFVIAEFLWHVWEHSVPADPTKAHSCRAVCVNLPRPSTALGSFPGSTETWSLGLDDAPAIADPPTGDVWGVNAGTNNISVRNSNIVVGTAPPYSLRMLIVDNQPQNFQKMPNDFVQTFGKKSHKWGIKIDAPTFPGELVVRMAATVAAGAAPENMDEIKPAPAEYRFFILKGGTSGTLAGLTPREKPDADSAVRLFFQPSPDAKPGIYEITIAQTADGKTVGGYRTAIAVAAGTQARYVVDTRTKFIYDGKRHPQAFTAIPFENRPVYLGPGAAVREGFQLNPTDAIAFLTGALKNEVVNVPRGFKFPKRPQMLPIPQSGLLGAVVGRVVANNQGVPGIEVALVENRKAIGQGITDVLGRYLIAVKADRKVIPVTELPRKVDLVALDPKTHRELFHQTMTVADLCFAAKDIVIKEAAGWPPREGA